jgi:hypothetical protein
MTRREAAAALAYGTERYAATAAGKTLLVGWREDRPLFALAAGLSGGEHQQRFAVLARYLLRRDRADGYWLMLPAELAAGEGLVAEVVSPLGCQLQAAPLQRDASGRFVGLAAAEPLNMAPPLGDLLDGGTTLPALMRRELDGLALALAEPLPP